ncbi:MAG TPA: hypothetical protein VGC87_01585 [Pyrinomonadaceae bacterium]|jgi:hypothetical protein
MFVSHLALVSQTNHVSFGQLAIASAAIQKQIARDFGPIWGIEADAAPFPTLASAPLGYWRIIIRDDIHFDAQGIHLNTANGQPYALVQFSDNWALTTSHECLEMLADPSGNRTQAGNSVKPGQGRVEYLVEVCDPSEAARFGYAVNGVLLSDFYTPNFFDPVAASGVRYSFTGAIEQPRQVLDGGYLSWFDPTSGHVFQLFVSEGGEEFIDRGPLPGGFGSLREFADRYSTRHRMRAMTGGGPEGLMLTAALGPGGGTSAASEAGVDEAQSAEAVTLQRQIDALISGGA